MTMITRKPFLVFVRQICLGCVIGALATASSRSAANDPENPYAVIAERNVFRLNPPPPPPEPDKGPPPVLPDVYVTGFVRTGDLWKVYLVTKVENPDPHGAPLNVYLNLREGEKQKVGSGSKQAELELVKLYADKEKIDIINSGTPMTLTMKDNGFGSGAAAGTGAATTRKGQGLNRRSPPTIPGVPTPGKPLSNIHSPAEGENPAPNPVAAPPVMPYGGVPLPPPAVPPPASAEPTNGSGTIIVGGTHEE